MDDIWERQKQNLKAIRSMMEYYNVDEETATELWHRYIDTIKKIKELNDNLKR